MRVAIFLKQLAGPFFAGKILPTSLQYLNIGMRPLKDFSSGSSAREHDAESECEEIAFHLTSTWWRDWSHNQISS
jgi:hypothetical protein